MSGKLYIKTHGCQMNEYDSAKMADVLGRSARTELTDRRGRGRRHPDQHLLDPREGPGEGVQPAWAAGRKLKQHKASVVIGVGGCVASQEGEAIVRRAPYVDLVFGPQTLHRLPEMIEARRAAANRRSTSAFPKSRSSIACRTPRRRPDRIRFDHGRLFEVLQLLRRAVYARRGNQPTVR
jgi:tRNA-2-methylthio-N6-dimethylallyladenosine synthase